jgi:hypothetical protein
MAVMSYLKTCVSIFGMWLALCVPVYGQQHRSDEPAQKSNLWIEITPKLESLSTHPWASPTVEDPSYLKTLEDAVAETAVKPEHDTVGHRFWFVRLYRRGVFVGYGTRTEISGGYSLTPTWGQILDHKEWLVEATKRGKDLGKESPEPPSSADEPAQSISPYSSAADFAKYAMKLRERGLHEVPPLSEPTTLQPAIQRYPWKTSIVTTVFWIGGKANHRSAWDLNWASNYGGMDNPDSSARRDYLPTAFVPKQNPFYCALPYNDVTDGQFKPEAPLIIPWFKHEYRGPGQSVCRDRWVAIRKGNRTCYAEWEDCGPFRTDHFQYVFGNERPKPNANHGAGLNVSPAVRDYLGLAPTDVTDWQFVEVRDVPPGPWRSYGENNHFVIARRQNEQRLMEQKSQQSDQNSKK